MHMFFFYISRKRIALRQVGSTLCAGHIIKLWVCFSPTWLGFRFCSSLKLNDSLRLSSSGISRNIVSKEHPWNGLKGNLKERKKISMSARACFGYGVQDDCGKLAWLKVENGHIGETEFLFFYLSLVSFFYYCKCVPTSIATCLI